MFTAFAPIVRAPALERAASPLSPAAAAASEALPTQSWPAASGEASGDTPAIVTFDADVTLPCASTVNRAVCVAFP